MVLVSLPFGSFTLMLNHAGVAGTVDIQSSPPLYFQFSDKYRTGRTPWLMQSSGLIKQACAIYSTTHSIICHQTNLRFGNYAVLSSSL